MSARGCRKTIFRRIWTYLEVYAILFYSLAFICWGIYISDWLPDTGLAQVTYNDMVTCASVMKQILFGHTNTIMRSDLIHNDEGWRTTLSQSIYRPLSETRGKFYSFKKCKYFILNLKSLLSQVQTLKKKKYMLGTIFKKTLLWVVPLEISWSPGVG